MDVSFRKISSVASANATKYESRNLNLDLSAGDTILRFTNIDLAGSVWLYVAARFENVTGDETSTIELLRNSIPAAPETDYVPVTNSSLTIDNGDSIIDFNFEGCAWDNLGLLFTTVGAITGNLTQIIVEAKKQI